MIPKYNLDLFESLSCFLKSVPRDVFDKMLYYVALCDLAGHCSDDNSKQLCAKDFLEGERVVGPPGWRRKQEAQKERESLRGNIPEELEDVIQEVVGSVPFKQYCEGNDKALNSCVGMVMKQYKTDPALIKELLIRRKN